jgi:hypothetical protein
MNSVILMSQYWERRVEVIKCVLLVLIDTDAERRFNIVVTLAFLLKVQYINPDCYPLQEFIMPS